MLLTYGEIEGRWSEDEIVSLWETYDPDTDPPIALWITPEGQDLCGDCASNRAAEHGVDDTVEAEVFDPHVGCDDCKTVIAFD